MTDFQLDHHPYIALVLRKDVKTKPDDPVRLAIHAPGTACLHWSDHWKRNASFSYGFPVLERDCFSGHEILGLSGPACLKDRVRGANPGPWKIALDRLHPLAGTGLDAGWRSRTLKKYWPIIPAIGMILQVEPNHDDLRTHLERATDGKRPFTHHEKKRLLEILRKRGAVDKRGQAWDQELRSHHRVIKRRRDLAFRLARLTTLDLRPEDLTKVKSLQTYNVKWRAGQMLSLSEAQERLVGALEGVYREQRAEASSALAQILARRFGIDPLEDAT